MQRLYKGRFMIGIYALEHEGETCLAICETIRELARLLNTSEVSARMMLSNIINKKNKYIKYQHKMRTIELIDMLES